MHPEFRGVWSSGEQKSDKIRAPHGIMTKSDRVFTRPGPFSAVGLFPWDVATWGEAGIITECGQAAVCRSLAALPLWGRARVGRTRRSPFPCNVHMPGVKRASRPSAGKPPFDRKLSPALRLHGSTI